MAMTPAQTAAGIQLPPPTSDVDECAQVPFISSEKYY